MAGAAQPLVACSLSLVAFRLSLVAFSPVTRHLIWRTALNYHCALPSSPSPLPGFQFTMLEVTSSPERLMVMV